MNTRVKKIVLYSVSIILIAMFIALSALLVIYVRSDKVSFDENKIYASSLQVDFYDNNNVKIRENNGFNTTYITLDSLPKHIYQPFISIEDKDFFKHKGLNYKRMAKAFLNNIKNGRIVEGASTISQQLIKNTHLSSEKTFSRKLNEIKITKKLEKTFSKKQILESYLNVIYFGANSYGIQSASEYYFSKPAKQLNILESATLAGIIKSPNYYSPITQPERCKQRRNVVLRELYEDKIISYEQLNELTTKPVETNVSNEKYNSLNSYSECALEEAMSILKMPAKQIAIGGYQIYTNFSNTEQENLVKSFKQYSPECDYCGISINKNGEVEAYIANANLKLSQIKRQPGSAIKPILVYAPAIEEGYISPETQILDEPIDINGYSPKNIGNTYHGYISAKEALSKSLNVPAVKIMSYTGIDTSKYYAKKCGITFDDNDSGYSIALGGFTQGTTLKQLATAFTPFINEGKYVNTSFIKYITDKNGKIIYINDTNIKQQVFRDDTAYLTTNMLKQATQTGTSKNLKHLNFEIASKSGTVGINNQNYDAWNITYTSNNITGVWFGNIDNSPIKYVGGGIPTKVVAEFYAEKYKNKKPEPFIMPSSIEQVEIDTLQLEEKHSIVKANEFTPQRYKTTALFSKFFLPKEKSDNFIKIEPSQINGFIVGNKYIINFEAKDYLIYELYKTIGNKTSLCKVISQKDGIVKIEENIIPNNIVSYYLITKIKNYTTGEELVSDKSNIIELINTNKTNFNINKDKQNQKSKWYV